MTTPSAWVPPSRPAPRGWVTSASTWRPSTHGRRRHRRTGGPRRAALARPGVVARSNVAAARSSERTARFTWRERPCTSTASGLTSAWLPPTCCDVRTAPPSRSTTTCSRPAWRSCSTKATTPTQRMAAATAVLRRVSVIAGGPGTGKTTTVARVLALLEAQATASAPRPPLVALAAPTGKAAARLEEAVRQGAADMGHRPGSCGTVCRHSRARRCTGCSASTPATGRGSATIG